MLIFSTFRKIKKYLYIITFMYIVFKRGELETELFGLNFLSSEII